MRKLATRGWDVAVLARGQERLDDTVRELHERGVRAIGISVDVADAAAVDRAADRVEDELGPIELWVNDAFTGAIAFFDELRPEEYSTRWLTTDGWSGAPVGDVRQRRRPRGTLTTSQN